VILHYHIFPFFDSLLEVTTPTTHLIFKCLMFAKKPDNAG